MVIKKDLKLGNNEIRFEANRWAKQADGSIVYSCDGSTIFLATVCAAKEPIEGIDFFPLTVEYREKFYSIGKIPGGFIKRESRPSEVEILTSRLIDRPIRPLFPDGYLTEVQVIVTVLSYDGESSLQGHAINAASAAITTSSLPFNGPIAAVVVGRIDDKFILNPTMEEQAESDLELLVTGTEDAVIMIEGEAKEIPAQVFIKAIEFARGYIVKIIDAQKEFYQDVAPVKKDPILKTRNKDLINQIKEYGKALISEANQTQGKESRQNAIDEAKEKIRIHFLGEDEETEEKSDDVNFALDELEYEVVRDLIFSEGKRSDGRKTDEIRAINIEMDVLPNSHGSCVFTRGETQSLGALTLGTVSDSQKYENICEFNDKKFMLHYNFPSFSGAGKSGMEILRSER
jgi:polyribonucleotide nucleotidyltransferase